MRVSLRQWFEEREEELVRVGTVQVRIGKQSKSRRRMRKWQMYSNKYQILSFIQVDTRRSKHHLRMNTCA